MSRFMWTLLALVLVGLLGCKTCKPTSFTAGRPGCDSCLNAPMPPRAIAPIRPLPQGPAITEAPPSRSGYTPPPPSAAPPPAAIEKPFPSTTEPPLEDDSLKQTEARSAPILGAPGPVRKDSKTPVVPEEKGSPSTDLTPPVEKEDDLPQPIDIPGFTVVRKDMATGLRPFPDGITWLKKHGYKVIVHLTAPGVDTTAARREIERKGIKYVSLEASPARMTKALYENFVRIVDDAKNQPVYVYDRDGSAAGGLWYLYNRVHLSENDETARAEAQRLGLRFDEDVEHKTMWLAVQTLLKSLKP